MTVRDLNGVPNTLDGFHVRFADLASLEEPNSWAVDWVTLQTARHPPRDPDAQGAVMRIHDASDVTPEYRSGKLLE